MTDSTERAATVVFEQEDMDNFGIASGGTGLIHTEPDYARGTSFGSTLVQGLYLLAVVEKQLCDLAPGWAESGTISMKFVSAVKSGDEFRVEIVADPTDPNAFHVTATAGGQVALVASART